ncbi:MAG: hypothetical protein DRN03_02735 [Thermoplasmata archaeon]|nr:MAG: hypothetical protein DRN03_02735 [Thermoplasmata archaeon]
MTLKKLEETALITCTLISLFLTLQSAHCVYSATDGILVEWERTFGGENDDGGFYVEQTEDKGYVVVGYTKSYGVGGSDVWLIKVNSEGEEEWNRTFGGDGDDVGLCVQSTDDGGYIVVGYTDSYGAGNYDIWLIKVNKEGDEEWNKTFGGAGIDKGYCVQQTTDGGYILAGFTESFGSGLSDVWLVKVDEKGHEDWNRTFGGGDVDKGFCVRQTSDGGYAIVGLSYSFGAGYSDIWLIKTNNNGSKEWERLFGGERWDEGNCLQYTTDGGYIILGYTYSYGAGLSDVWLIKVDSNGLEEWNKTFGEETYERGYYVQQTGDGGYVMVGLKLPDLWIIKVDHSGEKEWESIFGGDDWDEGRCIQQTLDGGYIVAGYTRSKGAGGADVWLMKLTPLNRPPRTPSQPEGQTIGEIEELYEYSTISTDPDGDMIRYGWDWDGNGTIDEWTGYYESGALVTVTHSWSEPGTYHVRVKAEDIHGAQSDFSPPLVVDIVAGNRPPEKPEMPIGETSGKIFRRYTYRSSTIDPDGDKVYYLFDWGDGTTSGWLGPYESGEIVRASHVWYKRGAYEIRVKAKDIYGAESEWSDPLPVTVPRKTPILSFLERLYNLLPAPIREILSILASISLKSG